MVSNEMTVLIADDHPLIRGGMISLLKTLRVEGVFLEAGDGREVFELAEKQKIDLFLIDYRMPGYDGYILTEKLIALNPGNKIIVVSMYTSETLIASLYWAGARDFLLRIVSHVKSMPL
jgi:DNA-binding NarL/FixJ family response regulator